MIPHIFIDPTIIVLATIDESYILLALMCAAAVCDAISLLFGSLYLGQTRSVGFFIVLAGIIMIFASNTPDKKVTPPVAPRNNACCTGNACKKYEKCQLDQTTKIPAWKDFIFDYI